MQLGEQYCCRQKIGEGKGQHLCIGSGLLSGLLACCKTESLRFLALRVQLVVLVSAFVMVSTVWSLSCFYSTVGAPVPCEVSATFVGQFHTKMH